MTESDDEITLWMNRLAEQPDAAAHRIWSHYYEKLVRYAAGKLGDVPRREMDEEDVALSALQSLHEGAVQGRFPQFDSREDLWKILLTIAGRKARRNIRRAMTQKRGGGKVRGESVFGHSGEAAGGGIGDVSGAEPTPEFAELVSSETEELLEQLGEEGLQRIAVMKLQGFRNTEIAEQLGCAVRSVERKLGRIRDSWQRAS